MQLCSAHRARWLWRGAHPRRIVGAYAGRYDALSQNVPAWTAPVRHDAYPLGSDGLRWTSAKERGRGLGGIRLFLRSARLSESFSGGPVTVKIKVV